MRSVPSWRALSFLPRVTACLDSAYLARDMCDIISAMSMVPRIKPKSNTVRNAKGSQAWREMVDLHMDNREMFDSEYHQCNIIESVFAALKKMYGDCTRCRRPDNWTREISIRAICYNIELMARSQVKDGRLTQDQIATLQRNWRILHRAFPSGTSAPYLGFG